MKELTEVKDGKIYYPLTPCSWVGKPKVSKVLDITMSCGGGMGGCKWHEYVEDDSVKEGISNYKSIDGKVVCLNSRWIVKAEHRYIVRVTYVHNNGNFGETMGMRLESVFISDSNKVVLMNSYRAR